MGPRVQATMGRTDSGVLCNFGRNYMYSVRVLLGWSKNWHVTQSMTRVSKSMAIQAANPSTMVGIGSWGEPFVGGCDMQVF